jgi:hypothetical protein
MRTTNIIDELVDVVEEAYEDMPTQVLNKVFLTLKHCMIETMKIGGCIRYKVPHMNKDRLQQEEILPVQLLCDLALIQLINQQLGIQEAIGTFNLSL